MPEIHDPLVDLIAEVTGSTPDEVRGAARFDRLGTWTSFNALQLLTGIEDRFGVRLNLRAYLAIADVDGLARAVAEEMP
ncbi:acyl carrier protein [Streptomyces sp. SP17BM10]|uniref:acyl carrier protein n=1 Tax=Streptomyces sp. SP17BM10 TaxID=3002530 RepID=UPI002E78C688|nr:acyl carrier protein [Streptomyces sp. SP17BM10]MEE1784667.1 acyl carrier protein [Streptomyces sp. SP17BM10]